MPKHLKWHLGVILTLSLVMMSDRVMAFTQIQGGLARVNCVAIDPNNNQNIYASNYNG